MIQGKVARNAFAVRNHEMAQLRFSFGLIHDANIDEHYYCGLSPEIRTMLNY